METLTLFPEQLGTEKRIDGYTLKQLSLSANAELCLVDYGYCLTAHKSQGSEWDSVTVIEEIWDEKWDAKRWRYTVATRDAKKLTYLYR